MDVIRVNIGKTEKLLSSPPAQILAEEDARLNVLKRALRMSIDNLKKELGEDLVSRLGSTVKRVKESPIINNDAYKFSRTIDSVCSITPLNIAPITTLYFCLFSLSFVILCSRVWRERRKTRIYYGDGTSELCYALGTEQMMNSYYEDSGSPPEPADENKERTWRIEQLKKVTFILCFSFFSCMSV